MSRVIRIDPVDLGPRNASVGDTMTVTWSARYSEVYVFDGKRWNQTEASRAAEEPPRGGAGAPR